MRFQLFESCSCKHRLGYLPYYFVLCTATLQGLLPFPACFKHYFSPAFHTVLLPCLLPCWSAVTNLRGHLSKLKQLLHQAHLFFLYFTIKRPSELLTYSQCHLCIESFVLRCWLVPLLLKWCQVLVTVLVKLLGPGSVHNPSKLILAYNFCCVLHHQLLVKILKIYLVLPCCNNGPLFVSVTKITHLTRSLSL